MDKKIKGRVIVISKKNLILKEELGIFELKRYKFSEV